MEKLLSSRDAMELLSVGRTKLWELERDGHVRKVQLPSGAFRYRMSDLETFIESLPETGSKVEIND